MTNRSTGRVTRRVALRGSTLAVWAIVMLTRAAATAEETKQLSINASYPYFVASHPSAAAAVIAALQSPSRAVKEPEVVVIGALNSQMYRCDCKAGKSYWNIAAGISQWAHLKGWQVEMMPIAVLVSSMGAEHKKPGKTKTKSVKQSKNAANSTHLRIAEGCLRADNPLHQVTFEDFCKAIDSGIPVIVTLALSSGSETGLEACYRDQRRVSMVGIGYEVKPTPSLLVRLPEATPGPQQALAVNDIELLKPYGTPVEQSVSKIPWQTTAPNMTVTIIDRIL